MSKQQRVIDEAEFQAFVDGQLPPERRRAVMAYLAAEEDEAARMSDYRSLNEALHLLYDEVLHEPLPERLRVERYLGQTSRLERWRSRFGSGVPGAALRAAAVAALILASGAGGWTLHERYGAPAGETPAMSFARQAANAHLLFAPDLRHPVEFGADQQDSLLRWLSERLGESVHAPNLQDIGFALVGGRLLPAAGQPAAQLMYENADAKRMTLYIRARWSVPVGSPLNSAPQGTVSYAGEGGISMVYWMDGPFAYALIAEMDREQLFATAETIQQQLQMPKLPAPTPEQTADKDTT